VMLHLPDIQKSELEGSAEITINMMAGRPVARVYSPFGTAATLYLEEGRWLEFVSAELAVEIAVAHLESRGKHAAVAGVAGIDSDQWTVYGQFRAHQPLYKVSMNSTDRDVIYVSGSTGEVVQDTHGRERFWNWLGAVPHWLYFKALRERHSLWYNLMVWSSALGTILVAAGLFLGIKRTLRAGGRWTRYLGPMRWHHLTGLVFGLLTLTWILSGLLSLNPWGLLEGGGAGGEQSRFDQAALTG